MIASPRLGGRRSDALAQGLDRGDVAHADEVGQDQVGPRHHQQDAGQGLHDRRERHRAEGASGMNVAAGEVTAAGVMMLHGLPSSKVARHGSFGVRLRESAT